VHYPEEEGIIQIENFGIHINDEGFLMYGRGLHLSAFQLNLSHF